MRELGACPGSRWTRDGFGSKFRHRVGAIDSPGLHSASNTLRSGASSAMTLATTVKI
jgi:hypothetical protein